MKNKLLKLPYKAKRELLITYANMTQKGEERENLIKTIKEYTEEELNEVFRKVVEKYV